MAEHWLRTTAPEHIPIDRDWILRRWRDDSTDVTNGTSAVQSSMSELEPFMPWATPSYDEASAAEFIQISLAGWADLTELHYAVVPTVDETQIVGSFGLIARVGVGGLEIGYWLRTDHTGRGIATRASRALVDAAFALPEVHRVEIHHHPDNVRSAAVPRRLGFTDLGVAERTVRDLPPSPRRAWVLRRA